MAIRLVNARLNSSEETTATAHTSNTTTDSLTAVSVDFGKQPLQHCADLQLRHVQRRQSESKSSSIQRVQPFKSLKHAPCRPHQLPLLLRGQLHLSEEAEGVVAVVELEEEDGRSCRRSRSRTWTPKWKTTRQRPTPDRLNCVSVILLLLGLFLLSRI